MTALLERLGRAGKGKLVKRCGAGAFLFFAVKGLLWLLIPMVLAALAGR